jgi:hypothetical protein
MRVQQGIGEFDSPLIVTYSDRATECIPEFVSHMTRHVCSTFGTCFIAANKACSRREKPNHVIHISDVGQWVLEVDLRMSFIDNILLACPCDSYIQTQPRSVGTFISDYISR